MYPYIEKNALARLPRHESPKPSSGGIRSWIKAATREWRRRKMIAALEAMDDRLLRDIGLYRGDIRNVVNGLDDRELRMTPVARSADNGCPCRSAFSEAAW
ncbi:DUF1127 domain-containing protein [Limimaricola cinnabarinus]|jgi:uncharacterized protein YjiS (DUF1127 family)|nr:DUF1127 domain-containing protein [Limimaricola cinnabarinus]